MNNKPLKILWKKRTDKTMKTVVKLERTNLKLNHLTVNYLSKNITTFNQFKVLEVLYHKGNLNIGSITKLTMGTPGNTTVVIRNLLRDNWITSIKDPNDNRASILSITEKRNSNNRTSFSKSCKNLKTALEVLSDEELNTLYDLLNKIYKAN